MPTYLNLTILALEYIQNFYKTLADASLHASIIYISLPSKEKILYDTLAVEVGLKIGCHAKNSGLKFPHDVIRDL